jgi:hypothetical protein
MIPCFDCRKMRRGKNSGDSMKDTLGFYICVPNEQVAIILDKATLVTLEELGCNQRQPKTP